MRFTRLFIAVSFSFTFDAPNARAAHYLYASPESTNDVNVQFVESSDEYGVPGVNDNYFSYHVTVSGASGHLTLDSNISTLGGGALPFAPTGLDLQARIRESMEVTDLGGGQIRASLTVDPTTDFAFDGPFVGPVFRVHGRLELGTECYVAFSQSRSPLLVEEPTFGDSCTDELAGSVGSIDGNTITASVSGDTLDGYLEVDAWIDVDVFAFGSGEVASYQVTGDLRVEAIGATAEFASPGFLTEVPEPQDSLAMFTALAAFALLSIRRRSPDARRRPRIDSRWC